MTATIFFIGDTHFGHENSWKVFKDASGENPLRPFTSTEEMDETMVVNWNRVVRPQDHVYHLGDVVIAKHNLPILARLSGHKRLLLGNHDIFPIEEYLKYFEKVGAYRVLDNIIFSHIPIRKEQINQRWIGNAHGHLHGNEIEDPSYLNLSVEKINFTPVALEEVKEMFAAKCLRLQPQQQLPESPYPPDHS
jgi:calcineurin-like phosphoesterase family protein